MGAGSTTTTVMWLLQVLSLSLRWYPVMIWPKLDFEIIFKRSIVSYVFLFHLGLDIFSRGPHPPLLCEAYWLHKFANSENHVIFHGVWFTRVYIHRLFASSTNSAYFIYFCDVVIVKSLILAKICPKYYPKVTHICVYSPLNDVILFKFWNVHFS